MSVLHEARERRSPQLTHQSTSQYQFIWCTTDDRTGPVKYWGFLMPVTVRTPVGGCNPHIPVHSRSLFMMGSVAILYLILIAASHTPALPGRIWEMEKGPTCCNWGVERGDMTESGSSRTTEGGRYPTRGSASRGSRSKPPPPPPDSSSC